MNIINNIGNEVIVTVNDVNGDTTIVIDYAKKKVELSTLKLGDIFTADNVEYIVLEQFDTITAVIRKELLKDRMEFGSNNNWKESDIRSFLNNEYLKELNDIFGKDNVVERMVDLLSMDGLDDYGISTDKVSLLTIDQYRKYRKFLGENKKTWWWLATPNSTPSGCGGDFVRYVDSNSGVNCIWCDNFMAVRPFFFLKSSIFVSSQDT